MLNVKVHGNAIRKRLNMCSLFGSAIRKKAASLGLQNCIGTNPKTSGTMPFGQTRQKWKCLSAIHCTIFSKNRTQHVGTNASYQLSSRLVDGWRFRLVVQPQDLGPSQSLSWPWTPLHTKIFSSQICLTAKTWPKVGHGTRQWHHIGHDRFAEKKEWSVAMV